VAQSSDAAVTWKEAVDVATGRGHSGPWKMND
jgi:hypothetical protein